MADRAHFSTAAAAAPAAAAGGPDGGGHWRKYGEKLYINENGDVQNFGGGEVSSVNENGHKAVYYNGQKVWSNDGSGADGGGN